MAPALKLLLLTAFTGLAASDVLLEDFSSARLRWQQQNDPVMGGKSTGSFTISGQLGVFDGDVVDVPYLKAPGFIKATGSGQFADASGCKNLQLELRTNSSYHGFRVSIGTAHAPGGKFFAYGYKAPFTVPAGDKFARVSIPFVNFSDYWDDGTGNLIKTCQDDKVYCPDQKTLRDMKTLSIWAEGVAGKVHLEIKSLSATGCGSNDLVIPETSSSCSGPIQPDLRYNISHTLAANDWAFPVPHGDSLAGAVCCDPDYAAYAEPTKMFARADVDLFGKMNQSGTTTFYDSVCGLPLFVVPRGRTLAEFQADTTEHGWPSFRAEELVAGNSHIVNETGEVLSKCGTHLGSYLPDAKGPRSVRAWLRYVTGARWCLDLSCVAGNLA